ncbi:hypothetical protein [Neolewinella persica]|uniref:hypothetical protein n=1 Tax=Neolewinella persica TaxID=70998 RepID=UPI000361A180|nr:hypothetical protein [Neolewinella persica]
MIKKYSTLIGVVIGTLLLIIATLYYPGGTYENVNSVGYDWANNYISNLLRPLAVNGVENTARPLAIFGVLFLTASFGLFFVNFSNRIKIRSASLVIKYLGILATILGLITVVPSMHDLMVTMSSMLTLLIFFYITVMVVKSKLNWMKVMSIIFLLTFYFGTYMYFTRSFLEYMPIMQKIIFLMKIIWILSLEYLTRKEDFQYIIK